MLPWHGDGPWVPSTEALLIYTWRLRASPSTSQRTRLREGGEQGSPRGWLRTAQALGEARGWERGRVCFQTPWGWVGRSVEACLGEVRQEGEFGNRESCLKLTSSCIRLNGYGAASTTCTSRQQGPDRGRGQLSTDRAVTAGTKSTQRHAGTGGYGQGWWTVPPGAELLGQRAGREIGASLSRL